jgi:hypothetical protein
MPRVLHHPVQRIWSITHQLVLMICTPISKHALSAQFFSEFLTPKQTVSFLHHFSPQSTIHELATFPIVLILQSPTLHCLDSSYIFLHNHNCYVQCQIFILQYSDRSCLTFITIYIFQIYFTLRQYKMFQCTGRWEVLLSWSLNTSDQNLYP